MSVNKLACLPQYEGIELPGRQDPKPFDLLLYGLTLLTMFSLFTPHVQALSTQEVPSPRLHLGDLTVIGEQLTTPKVQVFRGVPFAEAPTGDNRWRAPKPYLPSKSPQMALEFAPACYQGPHIIDWYQGVIEDFGGDPTSISAPMVSEDCLYLNIWRPNTNETKLPIVVFIHGGSNRGGFSYEPNYLGHNLADTGLIVITIAYRLGVFGFFAHPELSETNFGLLDQIAALTFIRTHAEAIGGDPNRITVMGESSGANSIGWLITSPLAEGLFQRAIHQSGGSAFTRSTYWREAADLGATLTATLSRNASIADSISAARQLTPAVVLKTANLVYQDVYFDPVIDGKSLPDAPRTRLKSGNIQSVDLLIGSNRDERRMYLDPSETLSNWLDQNVSAEARMALQPRLNTYESEARALDVISTAKQYVCPSLALAKAINDLNNNSYVYEFDRVRPGKMAASMGAYHGAELPYIFNTHDTWLPTDAIDVALTRQIQAYWRSFIETGNPNSGLVTKDANTLPFWPNYGDEARLALVLDDTISTRTHSSTDICNLFAKD